MFRGLHLKSMAHARTHAAPHSTITNPPKKHNTGHSLGGSVGELIAYYTALLRPHTKVDMVSFGSPNVRSRGLY